jgi:hypothetical protein
MTGNLDGDVAARMSPHRFREPVGLRAGDARGLIVVAVARGLGLREGEARIERERAGPERRSGSGCPWRLLPLRGFEARNAEYAFFPAL